LRAAPSCRPFLGHGHWWSNAQQSGAGWFWDHVHPNDAGHSALRDVFWDAIDDAFSTL
jgi:lysophospholipase L1-like esterase